MIPVESSAALVADLRDRCFRSDVLLAELARELGDGDSAAGLVRQLQLVWEGAPAVEALPPDVRAALARTQEGLTAATSAGLSWMANAADHLNHLARGWQMQQAYTAFDDR